MGKQFANVNARYGSPMGRSETPLGDAARSVRLFRVRVNVGGYDDGGAYWGIGQPLYCAQCDDGGRQFVRADGPLSAIVELRIECRRLKKPPRARFARLCKMESAGQISASGVILRQRLQELGF